MTRYIKAFSWPKDIERFLKESIRERPLLNVCCGESLFGDVRMDKYNDYSLFAPPDVIGDMEELPFENDSFGAVFSDPPWYANYKQKSANFIKDALRVAPVVYLMSPWIYGSSNAKLTDCWVRQHPGINNAIVLARYERADIVQAQKGQVKE